jgi:hypothetical protein
MPAESYPKLDIGKETGVNPSQFRTGGRHVTVVGATIDGEAGVFDNGVLQGKSKAEQGIQFGPEVLRAVGGKRLLALWLAAAKGEDGKSGWIGLTVGEMRVDPAKKEGYRDAGAFQTKLTDAAKGRVTAYQLKDPEKKALLGLLRQQPDLWVSAVKSFRDAVVAAIPDAASLGAAAPAKGEGYAVPTLGAEGGVPPTRLRSAGREVVVYGCVVDGGNATWDNGLLVGKAKAEQGIQFGPEVLRAVGGKRVCGVWVSVAADAEGRTGWFGATVGEMRVSPEKKEGFRDVTAWSVKLNDAARGRADLWRLKPDERKAVGALLQAQAELWEFAVENIRDAVG